MKSIRLSFLVSLLFLVGIKASVLFGASEIKELTPQAQKAYKAWDKPFEETDPANQEMIKVLSTMYYVLPARVGAERAQKRAREEQFESKFGLNIREVGLPIESKGFEPTIDAILQLILPKAQELISHADTLKEEKDPEAKALVETMYSFLFYIFLGYDYPGADKERTLKVKKSLTALEDIIGSERANALKKEVGESIKSPVNFMQAWYRLISKPETQAWCIPSVDFCLIEPFSAWDILVNLGLFVLAGTLFFGKHLAVKRPAPIGGP